MTRPASPGAVLLLGDGPPAGAYVLRIRVARTLDIAFGRFMKGRRVRVPRGDYLYVGSAGAAKGAASLPYRLLRHATRSQAKPPHRIREEMFRAFLERGMLRDGFIPPKTKRLHWNVDHLLDHEAAEITGVIALRSSRPCEREIARMVEADPRTQPVARGLGAHDSPGATHLLRVAADAAWWDGLPKMLDALR